MTSLPKPLFSGSRKYPYLYHGQHLQSLKGEGEGCPQTGIQRAWGTHWTGIPGVGDFQVWTSRGGIQVLKSSPLLNYAEER